MRIAKQHDKVESMPNEPIVNACEHGLNESPASKCGMYAHLGDSADAERAPVRFHSFLVYADVCDNGAIGIPYDPAMRIGFAKIALGFEHDVLRLREARRQESSDLRVQRGIHRGIGKILHICMVFRHGAYGRGVFGLAASRGRGLSGPNTSSFSYASMVTNDSSTLPSLSHTRLISSPKCLAIKGYIALRFDSP